jgi:hypothetical protein
MPPHKVVVTVDCHDQADTQTGGKGVILPS